MAIGFGIWKSVVTSYTTPKIPPIDMIKKKASENDAKATNAISCKLSE
jgi:hypothetical protein